jgi:uncharacterized membrane protein YoaK (UPF0700 family)
MYSFIARHRMLFILTMAAFTLSSCASSDLADPSESINIPIPSHIFGVSIIGVLSALFIFEQWLASNPNIAANSTFQFVANLLKSILGANKPPEAPVAK